jgi:hypothetical protein
MFETSLKNRIWKAVNHAQNSHSAFVLEPIEDGVISLSYAAKTRSDVVSLRADTWLID